jgi:uncharacterized protein (TIGR02996 family)
MTDRDAMLRAIAANPDDDTPRLIYADLLDELGGGDNAARARFIRLQIETHRPADYDPLPADHDSSRPVDEREALGRERKRAEVAQLANCYHSRWLRELPTWCNPMFGIVGTTRANLFARGFVERVTARAKQFAMRAEELFDEHPVRAIELQGGSAKLLPAVLARPELARLRALTLSWPDAPVELASALAECLGLSGLTTLDLSECALGDAEVRALARSVCLPALRKIRLSGSPTVAGVRVLAASAKLGNLREIDVLACRPWVYVSDLSKEFPGVTFHG